MQINMVTFDDLSINVSLDGETFHVINVNKNDNSDTIIDKVNIKEFYNLSYAYKSQLKINDSKTSSYR